MNQLATGGESDLVRFKTSELVYQYQSEHQAIEVSQNAEMRLLRTDHKAVQSALLFSNPEQLILSYMQAMMTALLFQENPTHILLLGLGGGDLLRFLHKHLPAAQFTAIDIDASMIEVSRNYFALPTSKRINTHVAEAMHFLEHDNSHYDLLLVDIYSGSDLPSILESESFYQRCHEHLENDGMLVLNVLTTDANRFRNILWLIRQRFDRSTLCLTVPQHINILVFAFKKRPLLLTHPALQAKAQLFQQATGMSLTEWVKQLFSTNPTKGGELIFSID